MFGELVPVGGGDPIPLFKKSLLVGRRESCDIVLRFPNVSTHHCQMHVSAGYWYVRDLQSRNGVKVNGIRLTENDKRLDPGDILSVAKHKYEVRYSPTELGAVGPPPCDDVKADIFSKSLLERAGLQQQQFRRSPAAPEPGESVAYDPTKDDPGQLRFRYKPL
jgi:adenylate cyclase